MLKKYRIDSLKPISYSDNKEFNCIFNMILELLEYE